MITQRRPNKNLQRFRQTILVFIWPQIETESRMKENEWTRANEAFN